MKKFLLFVILPIFIFILLLSFWNKFRPFIICPKWYHRTTNISNFKNIYSKDIYCKNYNWNSIWYKYSKWVLWNVTLLYLENDKIIKIKYYDSKWHLYQECYQENWLERCISYYDWNFNFLKGIRNLFKWIWSRYNTWQISRIQNSNGKNYEQWPYYVYYKNWNLLISWYYNNWSEEWIWISYYENWNIKEKWIYISWIPNWIFTWYYENWDLNFVYNYENWDLSYNHKEFNDFEFKEKKEKVFRELLNNIYEFKLQGEVTSNFEDKYRPRKWIYDYF